MIMRAGVVAALCSAGATWAQSSVSVYGFLEAQVGKQTRGSDTTSMFDIAGSRLGFTGTEDLGGGTKASFLIEHRLSPGTGEVTGGSTFWAGGSYVSLSNNEMGSVKIGRWFSQSFLKSQYPQDPFGMTTLGLGAYGSAGCGPGYAGGCLGTFFLNNSLSYEKSFGGFSVGAQVGEAPTGGTDRPVNVGLGYSAGAFYAGLGYEAHNDGSAANSWTSLALNYNLDVVKLYGGYGSGQDANKVDRKNIVVGFSAPVGKGAIIGSYNVHDQNSIRIQELLSLGYKYNLSARTNVFAVVANDNKADPGTNKSGFALGMFHSF